ncbi:MAG: hypothetical protein V4598_06235 [Bdellovibrionota bacterium]
MKVLLSLLVLLIPLKGFSPQEGGGGNVCSYRGELVLLDEFYSDYGNVSGTQWAPPQEKPVYRVDETGEKILDLTKMETASVFLKTLNWYRTKLDKDLFRELQDYFMALDTVYMKREQFMQAWSPDGHYRIGCAKGFMRALIVSTPEGVTMLSQKDWDQLHPQRKQIVMFHETLRLAQIHTDWFKDVMNDELSVLTMMLFHGAMRDITSHPAWSKIVSDLKAQLYTTDSLAVIEKNISEAQDSLQSSQAVSDVNRLSMLLKQKDIKLGREPGLHFSNQMKILRANPLYQAKAAEIVRDMRNH